MDAEIRITQGDAVSEFVALWDFLRDDPEVRRCVRRGERAIGPTEMAGGVVDVLSVALGGGGVGAALAGSLTAWLKSRQTTLRLELKVGERYAKIECPRPTEDQLDRLLEILAATTEAGTATATDADDTDDAA